MSTSDALSNATERLTLSADSTPDFLLSPFVLISIDDHAFPVGALKLAAASNVFRDMLRIGVKERECKVTESKEDIDRFVKAVEKGEGPVDEEEWCPLFKMSDKYDASALRTTLKESACSSLLYIAGCQLNDEAMMQAGALKSLEVAVDFSSSTLDEGQRRRMHAYHRSLMLKQKDLLLKSAPLPLRVRPGSGNSHRQPGCSCPRNAAGRIPASHRAYLFWLDAVRRTNSLVRPDTNPAALVRDCYKIDYLAARECNACQQVFESAIQRMEEAWNGNEGKKSIKC